MAPQEDSVAGDRSSRAPDQSQGTSVAVGVAALLFAMIALKVTITAFSSEPERRIPGPESGDLTLLREALPESVTAWKLQHFQPALPSEQLSEWQWWWTHAWHYSLDQLQAIVAFDQAGWPGWHELTICYRAGDWTMNARRTVLSDDGWHYVVAEFSKGPAKYGFLVFSEFFEDGSPVAPRDMSLSDAVDRGVAERFRNRTTYQPAPDGLASTAHDRVLQCQVFVASARPLNGEVVNQVLNLHLKTRQHLLTAWTSTARTK